MKKNYISPEAGITEFECSDIITDGSVTAPKDFGTRDYSKAGSITVNSVKWGEGLKN